MICVQSRIRPKNWDVQIFLGFWDTNESPILGQMTVPSDSQQEKKKEKKNLPNSGLCRSGHREKLKESKKRNKYVDLARKL